MKEIGALVLAAGRGTRMKSDTPKVLHEILGKPIIGYILDALNEGGVDQTAIVIGYGSDLLKEALKETGVKVVIQKELLGSGHAVLSARRILERNYRDILVVCGDTPLIKSATIKALIEKHRKSGSSATVLTVEVKDPTGYGRIVRSSDGKIEKIVEEVEARFYEEVINEINVGAYCFRTEDLFEALDEIGPDNEKKEYFLTDVIEILSDRRKVVESFVTKDTDEVIGVNTRVDLAEATRMLKERILKKVMLSGVTIEDPSTTTIYPGVTIGYDSVIHPHTVVESDVTIGCRCRIGPFARIRGGVRIEDNAEVGNFVELVRTRIGKNTRVKHHTYLGDTTVGRDVNIGAGTITANFDGTKKNRTIIEDGAFIGVGVILVAPVRIGKRALVGAGAVVPKNHDVPKGATVIGVPARVFKKKR